MIYARGGVVLQTTSRDEMLSWTQGGVCDSCMSLTLPTGPGNEITAAVGTYTNLVLFFSLYCFMCFHTLFFCFFFFFLFVYRYRNNNYDSWLKVNDDEHFSNSLLLCSKLCLFRSKSIGNASLLARNSTGRQYLWASPSMQLSKILDTV